MASLKLCLVFIIFTISALAAEDSAEKFDGSCFCAMFRTDDDPSKDEPLLVSDPEIPIPHNVAGAKSCLRICIALFAASKDNAAKALCQVLKKDVSHLRVTIYFRLCDEEKWASSRNANRSPICCRNRELIECP